MVRAQKVEHGFEEKVNDYLRGFKSEQSEEDRGGNDALDEYLLERAAQQLRAASDRLRKLERALEKG
ncbi:MAG: hypothetical protein P8Y92_06905 [Halioglobus sp.]